MEYWEENFVETSLEDMIQSHTEDWLVTVQPKPGARMPTLAELETTPKKKRTHLKKQQFKPKTDEYELSNKMRAYGTLDGGVKKVCLGGKKTGPNIAMTEDAFNTLVKKQNLIRDYFRRTSDV